MQANQEHEFHFNLANLQFKVKYDFYLHLVSNTCLRLLNLANLIDIYLASNNIPLNLFY